MLTPRFFPTTGRGLHQRLSPPSELEGKAYRPLKDVVAGVQHYRMVKLSSQSQPTREGVFDAPP